MELIAILIAAFCAGIFVCAIGNLLGFIMIPYETPSELLLRSFLLMSVTSFLSICVCVVTQISVLRMTRLLSILWMAACLASFLIDATFDVIFDLYFEQWISLSLPFLLISFFYSVAIVNKVKLIKKVIIS